MGSFTIGIEFSRGWCDLSMADEQQSVRISNTCLTDGFAELVDSVDQLLDGKKSVSCRWPDEPGGNFIDMVTNSHGELSIAVHQFYDVHARTPETIWDARRGEIMFTTFGSFQEFVLAFAAAMRKIRTLFVDAAGMIEDWQYPFPQTVFERIERKAGRLGYKPKLRREVLDEASGEQDS